MALPSAVTGSPLGSVPDAVAVLSIEPLSTSAWVTVYVAEQVAEAPGAIDAIVGVPPPQSIAESPGSGSETVTAARVTLPVLVTTKE